MAITALHSAATGLRALSTRIDVVANNLANAETTAFKRSRLNFEDLYYLTLREPGTINAAGDVSPAGIQVGLGTKISNSQIDLEQGSLESTNRPLDVGIQGDGFFAVKILNSIGNGVGYTRNGNFFLNKDGEMVIGMGDGYKLVPPITIPAGSTNITISQDGRVDVLKPGQTNKANIGQLKLYQFINPQGLKLQGGSIYTETEASGPPTVGNPGDIGFGHLQQFFLEQSNVNMVSEMTDLITAQRAYEINSKVIQASDSMMGTITQLR